MQTRIQLASAVFGIGALLSSCASDTGQGFEAGLANVGSTTAALVAATPLPDAMCPDNLNSCTANDVVTTVVSAEEIGGDDCTDGFIDVQWTFEFATTANERYDLGVFVSKDGGTVQEPSSALACAGAAPQVGDGDLNSNPDGDSDLFEDNDGITAGGPDTCGDLSTAGGPVQWTVSATVACNDVTPQGELTVQSCRVWEQNANHMDGCTGLGEAGTGSKCDCDPIVLEVDPCSLIICDDGNVCNGEETCDSSSGTAVCTNGTPLVCDDGLFCNGVETCDPANACQAGAAPDCNDGVSCTDTRATKQPTRVSTRRTTGSAMTTRPARSTCAILRPAACRMPASASTSVARGASGALTLMKRRRFSTCPVRSRYAVQLWLTSHVRSKASAIDQRETRGSLPRATSW